MTANPEPWIRSQIYSLLYHALDYPGEETGIPLTARDGKAFFSELGHSSISERANELFNVIETTGLEDLQVEYVRLFDYRPICPPCESAYRKNGRGQDLMADLMAFYREATLECAGDFVPDHLSVEFEFMHFLSYKESRSGDTNTGHWRDLQKTFLDDHILTWVPAFCNHLREEAGRPYSLFGILIQEFLSMEQDRLCRGMTKPVMHETSGQSQEGGKG